METARISNAIENTHLEIAKILFSNLNLFAHPHQLPGRKRLTAG